jgi:Tol biopolymer transport system component
VKRIIVWMVLIGSMLVGGCAGENIEAAQATNTNTNTATSTVERCESTPTSSPVSTPTIVPIIPELTVIRLTANGDAKDWYPIWFPDGKRILFLTNRNDLSEYYVMNADGSQPYPFLKEENPSGHIYPLYRWSPDGIQGVAAGYSKATQGPTELYTFKVLKSGDRPIGIQDVTLLLDLGDDTRVGSPTWSPDGEKIAFSYIPNLGNLFESHLNVLDLKSGDVVELLNDPDFDTYEVRWSPNGEWIAFSGNFGEENNNVFIYLIKPNGSGFQQLTNLGGEYLFSWSPDSNWIVFDSFDSSDRSNMQNDLYLVNVGSGETSRLTNYEDDSSEPDWSPDGKWVVFTSRKDNKYGITDIYLLDMSWLEMEWDK